MHHNHALILLFLSVAFAAVTLFTFCTLSPKGTSPIDKTSYGGSASTALSGLPIRKRFLDRKGNAQDNDNLEARFMRPAQEKPQDEILHMYGRRGGSTLPATQRRSVTASEGHLGIETPSVLEKREAIGHEMKIIEPPTDHKARQKYFEGQLAACRAYKSKLCEDGIKMQMRALGDVQSSDIVGQRRSLKEIDPAIATSSGALQKRMSVAHPNIRVHDSGEFKKLPHQKEKRGEVEIKMQLRSLDGIEPMINTSSKPLAKRMAVGHEMRVIHHDVNGQKLKRQLIIDGSKHDRPSTSMEKRMTFRSNKAEEEISDLFKRQERSVESPRIHHRMSRHNDEDKSQDFKSHEAHLQDSAHDAQSEKDEDIDSEEDGEESEEGNIGISDESGYSQKHPFVGLAIMQGQALSMPDQPDPSDEELLDVQQIDTPDRAMRHHHVKQHRLTHAPKERTPPLVPEFWKRGAMEALVPPLADSSSRTIGYNVLVPHDPVHHQVQQIFKPNADAVDLEEERLRILSGFSESPSSPAHHFDIADAQKKAEDAHLAHGFLIDTDYPTRDAVRA